ncbi:MoxR family ATPase [Lentisphaera marina]|uniref:AAA family ATPase n=1 Tax=Lentisphaera marina TaxID=1111041 RepID=UPI002366FEBD|nr:MoxR family ATPase [Lentisphaera marina]MDD7985624.1 MoxR family ATPase [Lentisphaera marina]
MDEDINKDEQVPDAVIDLNTENDSEIQEESSVEEEASLAMEMSQILRIRDQVRKVVIGQDKIVDQVLAAFLAAGHVLIEGVPGLGKTLLVKAISQTFSGDFARVQFTPDLMPADVMGHAMFNMKNQEFVIRKGPVFCNLLLADEINRAPAKTQSALLEVMQESQVTIEGESHSVKPPFMVLATQNPLEQEGTYPLPEAQLDRFLIKVSVDYPEESDELELVKLVTKGQSREKLDVSLVENVISNDEAEELRKKTSEVTVDEQVVEYAVAIVRQTRNWSGISVGAGTRGALALIRIARAMALISGRNFVVPADVKEMALPVLRHRITLSPEMEIEGFSHDQVLEDMLDKVEAPRL